MDRDGYPSILGMARLRGRLSMLLSMHEKTWEHVRTGKVLGLFRSAFISKSDGVEW